MPIIRKHTGLGVFIAMLCILTMVTEGNSFTRGDGFGGHSVNGTFISSGDGSERDTMETESTDVDPYLRGKALGNDGDKAAALEYWDSVYESMKKDGRSDPRIGFRYIEWAVTSWEVDRYKRATEIHAWGLESVFEERFYEAVKREVQMTGPLLDDPTRDYWRDLLEKRDDRLFQEIRNFWDRRNIVPSSDYNERLIEHWERIRDARTFFTRNDNTVYGTDDRGLIYVRLGPPDRKDTGMLDAEGMEVRNRLYDLVDFELIGLSQVYNLQSNILMGYSPGPYEYWRYDNISDEGPVIYLFGQPSWGEQRFRLLESLEDFISDNNYQTIAVGDRGGSSRLRTGYFLQFMLYHEMATVDHYFADRLQEYEQSWYQSLSHNDMRGDALGHRIARDRAVQDMRNIRNRAPESLSMYDRNVRTYPVAKNSYRFLDEDTGAITYVSLDAAPGLLLGAHMTGSLQRGMQPDYLVKQGAVVFQNGELLSRHLEEIRSGPAGAATIDERFHCGVVVPLTGDHEDIMLQVFSELHVDTGSTFPESQSSTLLGIRREWSELAKPLKGDGSLEMSDIVLGSTGEQPVSIRSAEMGILYENEVHLADNLEVYFELYNLEPDDSGTYRYGITYQLEPDRGGLFSRLRSGTREVSLSWDATPGGPQDYQFFEVDLSHASPGSYTLQIGIEDYATGEAYEREVELELKEE